MLPYSRRPSRRVELGDRAQVLDADASRCARPRRTCSTSPPPHRFSMAQVSGASTVIVLPCTSTTTRSHSTLKGRQRLAGVSPFMPDGIDPRLVADAPHDDGVARPDTPAADATLKRARADRNVRRRRPSVWCLPWCDAGRAADLHERALVPPRRAARRGRCRCRPERCPCRPCLRRAAPRHWPGS